MLWKSLRKMLGLDPNDRALRKYGTQVEDVNTLSDAMEARSVEELRKRGAELRGLAREGADLNELLPEVFALAREVSWRTIGLRH